MVRHIMELSLYHVFKARLADRYAGPHDVSAYVSPFWRVVDNDAVVWQWKPKSKHRQNVFLSGKKLPNYSTHYTTDCGMRM